MDDRMSSHPSRSETNVNSRANGRANGRINDAFQADGVMDAADAVDAAIAIREDAYGCRSGTPGTLGMRDVLTRMLVDLPLNSRLIALLHYADGLTPAEIGVVIDYQTQQVEQELKALRQMVARAVAKRGETRREARGDTRLDSPPSLHPALGSLGSLGSAVLG